MTDTFYLSKFLKVPVGLWAIVLKSFHMSLLTTAAILFWGPLQSVHTARSAGATWL